jgi:hypothetical protein
MLKRFTSRIMIGDSENVAKKAVDEHKISGSLRLSSPNARLNDPAIHLRLSIVFHLRNDGKQSPCPLGPADQVNPILPISGLIIAAFNHLRINIFLCKVTGGI